MSSRIYFTPKGYQEFLEYFNKTEKILKRVTKEKSEAGAGQDGWHDEGFKLGIGEEMMWSKRFGEIEKIMSDAEIVTPTEQNEAVRIGNGVIIEYEDGTGRRFKLDGYLAEPSNERISLYSPLGSALLGKEEGAEVVCKIQNKTIKLLIVEIVTPSIALKWTES